MQISLSVKEGKYEVDQETKEFCAGVCKISLMRDLLCQFQNLTQFPVWIPVPQGTGYTFSTYHTHLRSHDCDCDPTVNTSTHVQNGFFHFLPRVNSNPQVRLGPPFQACYQQREQTEKFFRVYRGNDYHDCTSFLFTTDSSAFSLAHFCRCRSRSPPV